ncbi:MAG: 50S ribosomal protein L19 [bacterium]|nr:50S ribosomal protein L19 [bacterium]
MTNFLTNLNIKASNKDLPNIASGDTVRVHLKIKEGEKFRTQIFEGLVIARNHGSEAGATITVRKVTLGVGVERIFPLHMPGVEKIELVKKSKIRRAKLYYIREKSAKETRKKLRTKQPKKITLSVEESSSTESNVVESQEK